MLQVHIADTTSSRDAQTVVATAYALHADRLRRIVRARVRDDALAEDVVHEAFARLSAAAAAGRLPDEPGAWLTRVCLNILTSDARHADAAARHAHALVSDDSEDDPESVSIAAERARAVRDALADLRDVDREVLVLAAEGRNGEEIAELIGRTRLATRTLLCRARARIRTRLVAQLAT